MIRVLIVDDQVPVRERLAAFLKGEYDIAVVGQAGDGATAVDLAHELEPDVILMDVQMPRLDGIRATEYLRAAGHPARILLMSFASGATNVQAAAHSGANGFFLKGDNPEELVAAIRSVYAGEVYYSPAVTPFFSREVSR